MSKLTLYQYTCPSCSYTLYSPSPNEALYCSKKNCTYKEKLPVKNQLVTVVQEDSPYYIVKESFMVDNSCCDVRPVKAGSEVEVVKIKNGWGYCQTEDGLSFHIPMERLERK